MVDDGEKRVKSCEYCNKVIGDKEPYSILLWHGKINHYHKVCLKEVIKNDIKRQGN